MVEAARKPHELGCNEMGRGWIAAMDYAGQFCALLASVDVTDDGPNRNSGALVIIAEGSVDFDALNEDARRYEEVDGASDPAVVGPIERFHPGKHVVGEGIVHANEKLVLLSVFKVRRKIA